MFHDSVDNFFLCLYSIITSYRLIAVLMHLVTTRAFDSVFADYVRVINMCIIFILYP